MVNLTAERLNRGLRLPTAAKMIGVPYHVLQNAELGRSRPREESAKLIADFYGVAVTDIWPVDPVDESADEPAAA